MARTKTVKAVSARVRTQWVEIETHRKDGKQFGGKVIIKQHPDDQLYYMFQSLHPTGEHRECHDELQDRCCPTYKEPTADLETMRAHAVAHVEKMADLTLSYGA